MAIEEWKVGADAVIRDCDHYTKTTISRMTATQLVVRVCGLAGDYERKFNRNSGLEVGEHAGSRCLLTRPSATTDLYFERKNAVHMVEVASQKARALISSGTLNQVRAVLETMEEAVCSITAIKFQVK